MGKKHDSFWGPTSEKKHYDTNLYGEDRYKSDRTPVERSKPHPPNCGCPWHQGHKQKAPIACKPFKGMRKSRRPM